METMQTTIETKYDLDEMAEIIASANAEGMIQANQMVELGFGDPVCHTTCTISMALEWAGVDADHIDLVCQAVADHPTVLAALAKREVIREYNDATGRFVDADWTHELRVDGRIETIDGTPVYCDGCEPDCSTCRDAEASAKLCEEKARAAMDMIEAGELDSHDIDVIPRLAKEVFDEEMEYGDAPTWRAWYEAVETYCDALDED